MSGRRAAMTTYVAVFFCGIDGQQHTIINGRRAPVTWFVFLIFILVGLLSHKLHIIIVKSGLRRPKPTCGR